MLGRHKSLVDLVTLLESLRPVRQQVTPDDETALAMTELGKVLGLPVVEPPLVKPSGNDPTVLMYWQFVLTMMSMLERPQQEQLSALYGLSDEERGVLPVYPDAFDSHCHLDKSCVH